jgi:hypothetical protein
LLSANQLDDLVSPIALYPDPLLSQVLACTYPLELVEASQWLQRNPGLTGTALTSAAAQQNWDPSIEALVVFPDLVRRLSEDVTWTSGDKPRITRITPDSSRSIAVNIKSI